MTVTSPHPHVIVMQYLLYSSCLCLALCKLVSFFVFLSAERVVMKSRNLDERGGERDHSLKVINLSWRLNLVCFVLFFYFYFTPALSRRFSLSITESPNRIRKTVRPGHISVP